MSQGTINKYFSDKGYGFIKTEEYGLCYFHISDFDTLSTEPFGNILEGDIVELEIIPSEKEVGLGIAISWCLTTILSGISVSEFTKIFYSKILETQKKELRIEFLRKVVEESHKK